MKNTLAIIMAGGRGKRLWPLTKDRSKPGVPFGGIYRLIDITLSSCINSGISKLLVLPQYKCQSLLDHLEGGWRIFNPAMGNYLKIVPPQQRSGDHWYMGTADAVRQNLYLIEREDPSHVLILSGDHIYKMNYSLFYDFHREKKSELTISVVDVRREAASQYGVLEVDSDWRVVGFEEKPARPKCLPDDPDRALVSMGVYLFGAGTLLDVLHRNGEHDFGRHIIPEYIKTRRVTAYPFSRQNRINDHELFFNSGEPKMRHSERTRDSGYWRDVGELDEYWNANMDVTGAAPFFSLYGKKWPLITRQRQLPPATTFFSEEKDISPQAGMVLDSIISPGCIISGAIVRKSVLSPGVVVHSAAEVDESVVMDDVEIGCGARIKKAIIDKNNCIPPNAEIGFNPALDRQRFEVTPRGIVVVEKNLLS